MHAAGCKKILTAKLAAHEAARLAKTLAGMHSFQTSEVILKQFWDRKVVEKS
jgi:hypothetical protein